MGYVLGGVKPHVRLAAEQLGARFGLRNIGGFRVEPGSDHYRGLAIDCMIDDIPNGRAVGDAGAAYTVANAGAMGVTYVIWQMRIWSAARASEGWRPYKTSVRTGDWQHVRHWHVSFSETPGNGMLLLDTSTNLNNPLLPDGVSRALTNLDKVAQYVTKRSTWTKLGLLYGGALMVLMAVILMTGQADKARQVVKIVSMVKGGGK